jgi:hypothetical protein
VYGVLEGGRCAGRKVVARIPVALAAGPLEEGGAHALAVARRDLRFFDRASGKRTAAPEGAWR